jgi:hypothetical protein
MSGYTAFRIAEDVPVGNESPGLIGNRSKAKELQQALKTFGTTTDPGPIQNITVDGVVGHQTWWVPAGAAGATLASLAGLV